MKDSFAPALYAVYSNPLPGREAELHSWYEDVHIPDSLEHGLFDSVRRYRALTSTRAQLLTLWDCGYRDEADALAAVRPVAEKLRAMGRIEVLQQVVFQQFVFLEEVIRRRDEARARFLTTLHSCWASPSSLPTFDAWLADERNRDCVQSGASVRYGVPAPARKGLVLIEQDSEPDGALPARTEPELPPFGEPTPIFPSGSPAPGPPPSAPFEESQLASALPVWAARWQLISAR